MARKPVNMRPKTFPQRADRFEGHLDQFLAPEYKGYKEIIRDGRILRVGIGSYRGLVYKHRHSEGMERAAIEQKNVETCLKQRGIPPEFYEFVDIARKGKVQEYVDRPSISMLREYWGIDVTPPPFSEEERKLCERFVRRNPKITLQALEKARLEIIGHYKLAKEWTPYLTNILVLGVNPRNGRIRFAVIDF